VELFRPKWNALLVSLMSLLPYVLLHHSHTRTLLSLPRFISQRPRRSLMTVTRNRFSASSLIAPEIEPIAQHSVFSCCHPHSVPSTCNRNQANQG
jgi:hypothetical protein